MNKPQNVQQDQQKTNLAIDLADTKVAVFYQITAHDPASHLFEVRIEIPQPHTLADKNQHLHFSWPKWIPGSYLLRDFSKHVQLLRAEQNDKPVDLVAKNNHAWSVHLEPEFDGALILHYFVYGYDQSVRGCFFDANQAFFNGTSLCIQVDAAMTMAHQISLIASEWMIEHHWQVTTALPKIDVDGHGFGIYRTRNYAQLIDCPVQMGTHTIWQTNINGVPHGLSITGAFMGDGERLWQDVQRIVQTEWDFWGSAPKDLDQYQFLLSLVHQGYGGLEHNTSTALMAGHKTLLPTLSSTPLASSDYQQLLSLISHEYFHLWWVKRLRPQALFDPDLSQVALTTQLWWFEGITSYFDDYLLHLARLTTAEQYLQTLAQLITRVSRQTGRRKQTLASASFDAWTKFYQQDENAINAVNSYYAGGAIVALTLDLTMRQATEHQKTLQGFLRQLWQSHPWQQRGFEEGELEQRLADYCPQADMDGCFKRFVQDTQLPDLVALLATVGVELSWHSACEINETGKNLQKPLAVDLGIRVTTSPIGVTITHVYEGLDGHLTGLQAKDQLIAIDQWVIYSESQLNQCLQAYQPNESCVFHVIREGRLLELSCHWLQPEQSVCRLTITHPEQAQPWLMIGDIE